jgi:phage I-like protein
MNRNFAACAVELKPKTGEIQLFPAGEFVARDGRPGKGKKWRMTEAAAGRVIAAASRRMTPFVIDYEHQTLLSEKNGRPAPAAGWFSKLEWRSGMGLYSSDIAWTDAARKMIDADEYRFISPVFSYGSDGTVLELHMAGLTNDPAIDGMDEVAAAKFTALAGDTEDSMKGLLKLLGLAEDAGEETAIASLKAILANAQKVTGLETELAALKSKTGAVDGNPDPEKYVPIQTVKDLQTQVAALTTQINTKQVDDLVAGALGDGRLLPSMETWARDLGKSNVAALKSYIDNAQPIAALKNTQTGGKKPGESGTELDDAAMAVCKQMGISPDEYKKTLGA